MKNFFFALMFVATLTFSNTCAAKDIWVAHWNYENVDIYAMDDTITNGTSGTGKYFSVSTKFVSNGQLKQVVVWKFSKWRDDMWRYETSTMDGTHTTVVMVKSPLFEFCTEKLGWSYKIKDNYYY